MIATGLTILATELIMGSVFLKVTGLRLWDYRNCKFNYKGHIELKRGIAWFALGALIWLIYNWFLITIWR